MKIRSIIDLLDASVLCGEDKLDGEVHSACGCDMMSDVLAYVKEQAVLLSGLVNPQVVRTAEMMDMKCIVFVHGKLPSQSIIDLADPGIIPQNGVGIESDQWIVRPESKRIYRNFRKIFCKGFFLLRAGREQIEIGIFQIRVCH